MLGVVAPQEQVVSCWVMQAMGCVMMRPMAHHRSGW